MYYIYVDPASVCTNSKLLEETGKIYACIRVTALHQLHVNSLASGFTVLT
jgi:hypothetical protein